MKLKNILLILVISVLFVECQPSGLETVPTEIVGVWKTSAPNYEDGSFELTEDHIVFRNSGPPEYESVNSIIRIERVAEGRDFLYTIHYENTEGEEYLFAFYHYPTKGGTIRLKNQKGIEWRRVNSDVG
jgi:hypothetical protein